MKEYLAKLPAEELALNEATLLAYAIQEKSSLNIIEYLLDHGCSPNSPDRFKGLPMLASAAITGNLEVVSLLVSRGALVNEGYSTTDATALIAACSEGHAQVSLFFLFSFFRVVLLSFVLLCDSVISILFRCSFLFPFPFPFFSFPSFPFPLAVFVFRFSFSVPSLSFRFLFLFVFFSFSFISSYFFFS